MLGNALLIAVVYKNANQRIRAPNNYFILNMACADVLLQSVYAVSVSIVDTAYSHQYLPVAYHGSRRRAALPFISVYWSNVSLSLNWKFACDCLGSLFPGVLSTPENNNTSYYMEKSVLLGTKPLVDSIRHLIRDPSGVFSVCHLCECRIVQ